MQLPVHKALGSSETMQEAYDVFMGPSGTTWYFAGSGTQFAMGEQSGNAMNYLSEGSSTFGVVKVALMY